jgi:hypothetical protein
MDKRVKALWIDALRSGEYVQGVDYLRNMYNEYCCLGVLCDLAIKDGVDVEWAGAREDRAYMAWDRVSGERSRGALPPIVANWAGLTPWGNDVSAPQAALDLAGMNDNGVPFLEIADAIEREL